MAMRCVIAIDQGTTGSTVLVLDESLSVLGRGYREFEQIYPSPGWVEHNPSAIWESVTGALSEAIERAAIETSAIAAIGITNQRETTVLWERTSLVPVANAIVWQDRRTADFCAELKSQGHEDSVRATTGLVLDPYFSGTKLRWLLKNDSELRSRAGRGELAFGTVDSFLVAKLSGGAAHITDVSNASRTLLFGLKSLEWEPAMCEMLSIPPEVLPEVRSSAEVYAVTRGVPGLPDGIPISGMAGDQQSALFGQACFDSGDTKCTYGTGAFILMNTGSTPVASHSGLLSTVAWKLGAGDASGEVRYALEGSAFIAGAAVQWLRDGLGIIKSASEIESLASSVPDSGGVVVVPAFAGLGAPHWRPEARGVITGLTRGTTAAHIARATLEGVALQNCDIVRSMEKDSGTRLSSFRVDGGAAANNLLMQFQSDLLGVEIERPQILETTALGAAFLAGLGAGVWKSPREIETVWKKDRHFKPRGDRAEVAAHIERWNSAVAKA